MLAITNKLQKNFVKSTTPYKIHLANAFLRFHKGLSRTWSSLFDSLEKNGTFQDIIFVYMKIQCIGYFCSHFSRFVLGLEPPSPCCSSRMFHESYVGKDVRKVGLKFIEEQVKICHELTAFGGPEG